MDCAGQFGFADAGLASLAYLVVSSRMGARTASSMKHQKMSASIAFNLASFQFLSHPPNFPSAFATFGATTNWQ